MSDARAIAAKNAEKVAEETARTSYGRLLAWLSSRTRDVAMAEDALADAFKAAIETWPTKGIPDAPEAWLLTAARRKLIDQSRRQKTRTDSMPALALAAEEAEDAMRQHQTFPDERLKLLFTCAHPAIDASIRSALMLQTVLGLDAEQIASAFLVSPSAMSGRLVRAKRKIKAAGIPFDPPDGSDLAPRLSAVLEAIYAAFGAGWDDLDGAGQTAGNLTHEAIYLARLITQLLPEEAEGWGLLALMLHAEARREARRDGGQYVPLSEQNTELWDQQLLTAAEKALAKAWKTGAAGPYQIEAAIQSAHVAMLSSGRNTHADIVLLYESLIKLSPTIGAHVGYAAALNEAGDSKKALAVLDEIEASRSLKYQAYWAVRAHILRTCGHDKEANNAYDQAIGLAQDMATRTFLLDRKNKRDNKKT